MDKKNAPGKPVLTLSRIRQLEKELERCDREIDSIIQEYYVLPGAQNVAGNIGSLSILHADLVEQLANKKRELIQELKQTSNNNRKKIDKKPEER